MTREEAGETRDVTREEAGEARAATREEAGEARAATRERRAVRPRTRLTGPPGSELETEVSPQAIEERWVPAFALPVEPEVPGRYRTAIVVVVALAIVAALAYLAFRYATRDQHFDPSVPARPTATATASPTAG